ncbi:hypothetical protein SAMD00023353_4800590 [Rosellinia necatrix]|uniref:Uncharacterized protein n=1 Tax=Rosellinia necatrix TaxID=77044 RepID=A0A1S8A9S9_ROSNE|nr:hypothetical protein SAMD00023353_4800590 [Rosellinia necatrix]
MDNMSGELVEAMQASKYSTITLSDSSCRKIGGKVVFEVTAKGKRGTNQGAGTAARVTFLHLYVRQI